MVKKKIVKKIDKLNKNLDVVGNIEKDAKEVEKWMIERKKFLIKLGWIAGLVIVLLIVLNCIQ